MNENSRTAIDRLLVMYDTYKAISIEEKVVASKLAKAKLLGKSTKELTEERAVLISKLKTLSDEMTFASPAIWMMYKFEAYTNEAQPIRTMHDFRMHCSKPGYICTKRFTFLNNQLKKRGLSTLLDNNQYTDEMLVSDVVDSNPIKSLSIDIQFNRLWSTYEYYTEDGNVAKWDNYKLE